MKRAKRFVRALTFCEARAFVRTLGLKDEKQWEAYCKSKEKSKYIPTSPRVAYWRQGWRGLGDWLGTNVVSSKKKKFVSFKAARDIVRSLHLKTTADWINYCRSGKRPSEIPSNPNCIYESSGWCGIPNWLGTKT